MGGSGGSGGIAGDGGQRGFGGSGGSGGLGGNAGDEGTGGAAGLGGSGGLGGKSGGAGGGAMEIVVLGRLSIGGNYFARGGNSGAITGTNGTNNVSGTAGGTGSTALSGADGGTGSSASDGSDATGGTGGLGGSGGFGGVGGTGGSGGVGGDPDGGSTGSPGNSGIDGQPGSAGNAGSNGSNGGVGTGATGGSGGNATNVAAGGDGGTNGIGGSGAIGGTGGTGGNGGGGAGGTIKIAASVLNASNIAVDASGGTGSSTGGNGRLLVGYNAGVTNVTTTGAQREDITGSRSANPFIASSNATPFLPDLVDGAEIYGLTGLNTTSAAIQSELASVFSGAPTGVIAALHRRDIGPTNFSDNYAGFDALLYINLGTNAVGYPSFIVGATSGPVALAQQGVSRSPTFGGSGPQTLTTLAQYAIFMTLVPTNATNFFIRGRSDNGPGQAFAASLTNGGTLYLLRAPATYVRLARAGTTNSVSITGVANQQYLLEGNPSLLTPAWSNVGTGNTDNAGAFNGTIPIATNQALYYRVVLP
jgi:hypothetical protein